MTRQLRRYALTGVSVPEAADIRALTDVVPTSLAALLYTEIQDARALVDPDDDDSGRHAVRRTMVRMSARERVSLGVLAELLEQLSGLDPSIPTMPDVQWLATRRVDARERRVLLNDGPSARPYEGRDSPCRSPGSYGRWTSPTGPSRRGSRRPRSRRSYGASEPLGYRLAGPALPGLLDEPQLTALSRDLDAQPPFLTPDPIGLRHLVRLAARREETVGATAAWLAEWAGALGVEVTDPGPLASFPPPAWCALLPPEERAESRADDGNDRAPQLISAWSVLATIEELGDHSSAERHIAAVAALADAGLVERRVVDAARTLLNEPPPSGPGACGAAA
ncbi:hypothetical protein LT493_13110 [Streptomyces tricolor]|nr:hypothetical protein [Streptomyces tricolor]